MHESIMTDEQLSGLAFDVNDFVAEYSGHEVSLKTARKWFEERHHKLTRPIEVTLQAYGAVVRSANVRRWPYPMREQPWILDRGTLRPADLPKVNG